MGDESAVENGQPEKAAPDNDVEMAAPPSVESPDEESKENTENEALPESTEVPVKEGDQNEAVAAIAGDSGTEKDASEVALVSNVDASEEKQPEADDVQMEDVKSAQEEPEVGYKPADKTEEGTTTNPAKDNIDSTPNSEPPTEAEPEKPAVEDKPSSPMTMATPEKPAPVPSSAAPNTSAAAPVPTTPAVSGNTATANATTPATTVAPVSVTQPNPIPTTAAPQQTSRPPPPPQLIMPGALPVAPPGSVAARQRMRPPNAVGIPAAKRARSNGTLDAGIPMIPTTAPDLSDVTLSRYVQAARDVGIRLIATPEGTPRSNDPRKDFVEDHTRYMASIGTVDFKIRTIGGSKLDLFTLYSSVLQRGGVQNVISTRTFRLVAKALNLPRSCTSAAYILRLDYERLLYAYEQKHVWGRGYNEIPQLHVTDRVRTNPTNITPTAARSVQRTRITAVHTPQHTTPHTSTPGMSARPKRQAALAASSAVAAAAAGLSDDDDDEPAGMELRRTRTAGINMNNLTQQQEAIVGEEMNPNAQHSLFIPGAPGERERVVQALWSANSEDVAFALGTLNALSFDPRNTFQARTFPGILDALCAIMQRHLEDVEKRRRFGLPFNHDGPRITSMAALEVHDAGTLGGSMLGTEEKLGSGGKVSSLQEYGGLFNCVDNVAVDREQCAVVAVNILRNMSFCDRNAIFLAQSREVMDLSADILLNPKVPGNLRDGLVDMWINVSPYLHVSSEYPGHTVLKTCVKLLDPYLEGSEFGRFTNCGEILARLAASPERNEPAFVSVFGELLPRLVDMIGGKDRRYINAGLAALCNCSAFDWPARSRIARVPRCMPRLVNMLTDPELAPRAALTLLNLAEAPSNRSVILAYEKQLVEQAIKVSPASDTVASILYDLSHD